MASVGVNTSRHWRVGVYTPIRRPVFPLYYFRGFIPFRQYNDNDNAPIIDPDSYEVDTQRFLRYLTVNCWYSEI